MKNIKEKKYSILSSISKYSFVFIIVFSLVMPFVFVGANGGTPSAGGGTPSAGGSTPSAGGSTPSAGGGTPSATGVIVDAGIKNPIPSIVDIPTFIEWAMNVVLIVGIPLLVLAIIYAGFLYVKAQGNSGELEVAHRTLLYTIIGGFLLLGAFVIANAIGKTVEEIKSTT